MNKKSYIFNAVFSYDNDGISISFPDLPGCFSCGYSTEEAIQMAKESLELYLSGMKEEEIPSPSNLREIKVVSPNQKVFSVQIEI